MSRLVTRDFLTAAYTGFRSLFGKSFATVDPVFPKISTVVESQSDKESYNWLGAVPALREWIDERVPGALRAGRSPHRRCKRSPHPSRFDRLLRGSYRRPREIAATTSLVRSPAAARRFRRRPRRICRAAREECRTRSSCAPRRAGSPRRGCTSGCRCAYRRSGCRASGGRTAVAPFPAPVKRPPP